jgi:hypothetical protein
VDITAPLPHALRGLEFDSIFMFNLFHCVRGGPARFSAVRVYKELLAKNGVLTGCTVLGGKHSTNWRTTLVLKWLNWVGIFHNATDTKEVIEKVLRQEFHEVDCVVIGIVLLFKAKSPI